MSYSFTKSTTDDFMYIDYIAQDAKVRKTWTTFIHENSKSFTIAGVERIYKSITIYCSAILGSHSQIRTDIFGTRTAFDAREQFLANIEDIINSRIFRTSQKQQIKKTASKIDFNVGDIGMLSTDILLSMATHDMLIKHGISLEDIIK